MRPLLVYSPLFLGYAILCGFIAGRVRKHWNASVAYTRKIFHFSIFTMAAFIHFKWGFPGVSVYGGWVSLWVLFGCLRGKGFLFYDAIARPKDHPHETFYILVPLIATALGGLVSNLLFGMTAPVGYLVAGWGDAIGEPVGKRWGSHRYKVPSLDRIPAERSFEGSAAVLLLGSFVAVLGLIQLGVAPVMAIKTGLLCGLAGALVEAVSNHGLDNLTIQVTVSALAWWMLRASG